MTEQAKERRPMDATDLYRAIDLFIGDNQHHHAIERRWLAQEAVELKNLAHMLGVNGTSSFQKAYGNEIAAMRLGEIELKRKELAKSDQLLADEAAALSRPPQTAE